MRSGAYGWLVVVIGFLALSLAFSARSALGLAMPLWGSEFGWSRSFVSMGGAIALVVMAGVAPFAGNLVDRYGPGLLLSVGLIVVGLGMALTGAMSAQWQFLGAFSVIGGLGFGIVAMHVVSTAVAPYFVERRGLATGAATAGATAGQLIVVPLLAAVLSAIGWRVSFLTLAGTCVALALGAWMALRRQQGTGLAEQQDAPPARLTERLALLLRMPVFHALFWSFTICGFTTAGVIEVHLLPYAAACGFPPLPSALAYGVLSAFNMVGMVTAGYLADRVNRPLLLAAIYFLRALSFLLLMQVAGNYPLLVVFAVVFGLFDYSTVPVTAHLVASHIGLKVMGLTMGLLSLGHSLGAAAGAFAGGVLFDLFAHYAETWIASVVLAVAAGLIVLTIREKRDRAVPAPAVP